MSHENPYLTYATLSELIAAASRQPQREVCLCYESDAAPPYTRVVLSVPGDPAERTFSIALQVKLAATDPRHDRARLDTLAVTHHEDVKARLLAAGLRVRIADD